jgi:hypothetical protein
MAPPVFRALLVTLTCIAVAQIASAATAPLVESTWRGYDTGIFGQMFGPKVLAAGDIDGDGDQDVVTGNAYFAFSGLSVLRNLGDASYAPPAHYATSSSRPVQAIALTHFRSR